MIGSVSDRNDQLRSSSLGLAMSTQRFRHRLAMIADSMTFTGAARGMQSTTARSTPRRDANEGFENLLRHARVSLLSEYNAAADALSKEVIASKGMAGAAHTPRS